MLKPEISGSMTSTIARLGCSSITADIAFAPFDTVRTAKPAKRKLCAKGRGCSAHRRQRVFCAFDRLWISVHDISKYTIGCLDFVYCISVFYTLNGRKRNNLFDLVVSDSQPAGETAIGVAIMGAWLASFSLIDTVLPSLRAISSVSICSTTCGSGWTLYEFCASRASSLAVCSETSVRSSCWALILLCLSTGVRVDAEGMYDEGCGYVDTVRWERCWRNSSWHSSILFCRTRLPNLVRWRPFTGVPYSRPKKALLLRGILCLVLRLEIGRRSFCQVLWFERPRRSLDACWS